MLLVACLVSALFLIPVRAMAAAWTPTQTDLDAALSSAASTWGYSIPETIEIGLAPLNPCRANAEQSAITNVQNIVTTTTTTTNLEPVAPPVVRVAHIYTIRVNSNCRWSQAWLNNVVTHEYGHVLMGAEYHSKDKKSIMYWMVKEGGQFVTEEDRTRVQTRSELLHR